jgi:hypothetical protein
LFQVKGQQNIHIREVPCTYESFNQGDVFVLDVGKVIYVWMGRESNDRERARGIHFAKLLSFEECGSSPVIELDAANDEDSPLFAVALEFWNELGGKIHIRDEKEGGDDEDAEIEWPDNLHLFKFVS